jgi:hypothetical protein
MKSTRRIPIAMFLGLATMGSAMAQDKAAGTRGATGRHVFSPKDRGRHSQV